MTFATTLSRVAALCLLASAAHAAPVPAIAAAADSSAPVPATVYRPAASYRPAAPEAAAPHQVWREQNRIVGAGASMMPAMGDHAGHGAAGKTCCADEGCCKDSCCGKGEGKAGATAPGGHQHGGQA